MVGIRLAHIHYFFSPYDSNMPLPHDPIVGSLVSVALENITLTADWDNAYISCNVWVDGMYQWLQPSSKDIMVNLQDGKCHVDSYPLQSIHLLI